MGKVYTAKELRKIIEKDGWYCVGQVLVVTNNTNIISKKVV